MIRQHYALNAVSGMVVLAWGAPVRFMRLPWQNAYALAKQIVVRGTMAETQAGISVDRHTPQPVNAVFTPDGPEVKIDWGVAALVFQWTPAEAFAMANGLVIAGEFSQRWEQRGPGLTPREVDAVEESIVGDPILVPSVASSPPPSSTLPAGTPLVGEMYYYRPAQEMARVLSVYVPDHRADVLLPNGALLQGVAWSDLLDREAIRRVATIKSLEAFGRPSLG